MPIENYNKSLIDNDLTLISNFIYQYVKMKYLKIQLGFVYLLRFCSFSCKYWFISK